ncbi:hypothetical protein [Succinivibrio dextrinosolvens]|uniref:hypothetical protein n=1 Tax=Succinivibrio dextrinosolvens TaxID=83771 RepID=UPI00241E8280|nr:hypothetical protein [Succinivibrio dextrinosolvens]MBE6422038.1 hypothetical protein [Succinivibrio dextrinosolvens]
MENLPLELQDNISETIIESVRNDRDQLELLVLDLTKIIATTEQDLNKIKNKSFIKRVCSRISGETGRLERQTTYSILEMQNIARECLNIVHKRQILGFMFLQYLKNEIDSLYRLNDKTKDQLLSFIDYTLKFEKIHEADISLLKWERGLDYEEIKTKIDSKPLRLIYLVNEFYERKNCNWDLDDNNLLEAILKRADLSSEKKLSTRDFLETCVTELTEKKLVNRLEKEIGRHIRKSEYFTEALKQTLPYAPLFSIMHYFVTFSKCNSNPRIIKDKLLKKIFSTRKSIDYPFSWLDFAGQILNGIRISNTISQDTEKRIKKEEEQKNRKKVFTKLYNETKSDISDLKRKQPKAKKLAYNLLKFDLKIKCTLVYSVKLNNQKKFYDECGLDISPIFHPSVEQKAIEINNEIVFLFEQYISDIKPICLEISNLNVTSYEKKLSEFNKLIDLNISSTDIDNLYRLSQTIKDAIINLKIRLEKTTNFSSSLNTLKRKIQDNLDSRIFPHAYYRNGWSFPMIHITYFLYILKSNSFNKVTREYVSLQCELLGMQLMHDKFLKNQSSQDCDPEEIRKKEKILEEFQEDIKKADFLLKKYGYTWEELHNKYYKPSPLEKFNKGNNDDVSFKDLLVAGAAGAIAFALSRK